MTLDEKSLHRYPLQRWFRAVNVQSCE